MSLKGYIRKVQVLGKIPIPKDISKLLDIQPGQELEIYTVDRHTVILEKYRPACIFCSDKEGMTQHKGKNICSQCRRALKRMIAAQGRL